MSISSTSHSSTYPPLYLQETHSWSSVAPEASTGVTEDVEMADLPAPEESQETISPPRAHASELRSRVRLREPSPSESQDEEPFHKKRRLAAKSSLTISTSMEDLTLEMIRDLAPPAPTHSGAPQGLTDFFGRSDVPLLSFERFLTLSGHTIRGLFEGGFRLLHAGDFREHPTQVKVGSVVHVSPSHCSAWAEILDGEFQVQADFQLVQSSHGPREYWIIERPRTCLNPLDALELSYSELGL